MPRRVVALALLVVVVLAGCAGAPSSTTDEPTTIGPATTVAPATTTVPEEPTTAPSTTTTPAHPADPPTDVLGWEDGYWYDDPLDVDDSDGLNDSELHAVVARAMARVEFVRRLEFERAVPVEVISRAAYRDRTNRSYERAAVNETLHQNVKFEATFFAGESVNALESEAGSEGSNVLGYYSPGRDEIVIVSENGTRPRMDELTLSQELFHALQEHRFHVSRYRADTEERHNAVAGIVEGDANYVEDRYRAHCGVDWTCLTPAASGDGGGGGASNVGLLALRLQPYSDGPAFVDRVYRRSGWDGVNALYDAPPESTEQTIHPDRYRVDHPTELPVEDRSDANWSIPDLGPDSIDYAQFGEAGLFVALWYPSYVESVRAGTPVDVIVPYARFFEPGDRPGYDMYDYSSRYSAGWDGDTLVPYVRADSARTNQTGYVWTTAWDSPADAAEFEDGYRRLLAYHGAEAVAGHRGTFVIPDGDFADAFYVNRSGDRVLIVNAPTVESLSGVRAGAAPPA